MTEWRRFLGLSGSAFHIAAGCVFPRVLSALEKGIVGQPNKKTVIGVLAATVLVRKLNKKYD